MTRMLAVCTVLLAAALPASAQVHHFIAPMDGSQEVPPVSTPGYGNANLTLTIDLSAPVGERYHLVVSGNYFELMAPVNPGGGGAHIHGPAPVGVNAGVVVTLLHTGGTSGTLSFDGFTTEAVADMMLAHLTYINVHTSQFPAGEIRGQVIPSPGAFVLLGMGGILAIRRRR